MAGLSQYNNFWMHNNRSVDAKYKNGEVAWANVDEVLEAIPIGERADVTVKIGANEYWWRDGEDDADLILKSLGGPGVVDPSLFGVDDIVAGEDRNFNVGNHAFNLNTGIAGEHIQFEKQIFDIKAANTAAPTKIVGLYAEAGGATKFTGFYANNADGHQSTIEAGVNSANSILTFLWGTSPKWNMTNPPMGSPTPKVLYFNDATDEAYFGDAPSGEEGGTSYTFTNGLGPISGDPTTIGITPGQIGDIGGLLQWFNLTTEEGNRYSAFEFYDDSINLQFFNYVEGSREVQVFTGAGGAMEDVGGSDYQEAVFMDAYDFAHTNINNHLAVRPNRIDIGLNSVLYTGFGTTNSNIHLHRLQENPAAMHVVSIDIATGLLTYTDMPTGVGGGGGGISTLGDVEALLASVTNPADTFERTLLINPDGTLHSYKNAGNTASRPASLGTIHTGFEYYDTDLGRTITWTGTTWKIPAAVAFSGNYNDLINKPATVSATGNQFNALVITSTSFATGAVRGLSDSASRTRNVNAFNAMIAAAENGQLCIIPDGEWYFNGNLVAAGSTKRFNLLVIGKCRFTPGSGFIIGDGTYHRFEFRSTIDGGNTGAINAAGFAAYSGTGVYIRNADKCQILLGPAEIINFNVGVKIGGESSTTPKGSQYCSVEVGQIKFCHTQILLTTTGTTAGGVGDNGNWCNSNIFWGKPGQIGGGTVAARGGTYGIRFLRGGNQGDPFNCNMFFHVGFEGIENALTAEFANWNVFFGARFEGNPSAITNRINLKEDNSAGLGCFGNMFYGMVMYENYFIPGGKGINTMVYGPVLTPSGDFSAQMMLGNINKFMNVVADESGTAFTQTVNDVLSLGGMNGSLNERFLGRLKRQAGAVDALVPLKLGQARPSGAYTIPNNVDEVFWIGSVSANITTPSASTWPGRHLFIKNKGTASCAVLGVGTLQPGQSYILVASNGVWETF